MNNLPPISGAYYRVIEPVDGLQDNSLALCWTEDEQVHAQVGKQTFYYEPHEFARHFVAAPEGRAFRMEEMRSLLESVAGGDSQGDDTLLLAGPAVENAESALVTTVQRNAILEAKKAALLAKKSVEVVKERLDGLLQEQQKSLELAAKKWEVQLGKMNYAISSINLYLGRDEEVVCIQEGSAAPVEEPISIRQTVLYMDEETALNIEEGGLDLRSLSDFDKWLCQPDHLSQIMPEAKGIVALRLRRNEKFYANVDMWTQIEMKLAEKGTYFLVRNGERCWRVWHEVELPDHLFPSKQEFDELFVSSWNREHIRPGSQEYQRALNKANGLHKKYMQVVLLMQGLLDRTQIFKPLPVERVNLLSPDQDPSVVRLVRDAENALGTGLPTYREWRQSVNNKLDVGKRVVFGGTGYMSYQYESRKGNESRTKPKFVDWPERMKVYTANGRTGGQLRFAYPRAGFKSPTIFHFYPHDEFVLNFDDATEADIQHYLDDRSERHNYLSSFPLLRAALALKKAEREAEEPFVSLLVREVVARFRKLNATEEEVRAILATAVPWWKQKRKFSRSLTAAENIAYRQLLNEVELRLEIARNPAGLETADRLKVARNDWLYIGRDSGATVVVLRNVGGVSGLVTHETWDAFGNSLLSTQDWWMPGCECGRWHALAEQPEWESWPKHGRGGEFLSEPEYVAIGEELKAKAADMVKDGDLKQVVAVTADNAHFYLYGMFSRSYWSRGSDSNIWEWECKQVPWLRVKEVAALESHHGHWSTLSSDLSLKDGGQSVNAPETDFRGEVWSHENVRVNGLSPEVAALPFRAYGHRLVLFDAQALAEARKLVAIKKHKSAKEQRRNSQEWALKKCVADELERRFWSHEKVKYLQDGGVEGLWEDHKKTVKEKRVNLTATDLGSCVEFLLSKVAFQKVVGKTLADAWALANELGWKAENPAANMALPGDIVLKIEEKDVDAEDET